MKKQFIVKLCLFIILGISTYSKTLNFDNFNGGGKFVNAKGGVMGTDNGTPLTDVLGKMYISGDFAENNYSNIIKTNTILSTLKFSGVTISDSPLYKVKPILNPITNELSLELTRVKFTDGLVEDEKVGSYLEKEFKNSNNFYKNKIYNYFKTIDNRKEINKEINKIFGLEVFPLLTKQNFDSISNMSIENLNHIENFDDSMELGEVRANGSYNGEHTKVTKVKDFNDYTGQGNISSFWVEKKMTEGFKIGTVNSLSDSSFNMEPEKKDKDRMIYKDDMYISSGVYGVYKKGSIIYTSTLSLGGDYSHLDRYRKGENNYIRNYSTNKSYFIGSNNSISRKYDLKQSYITPKIELNAIGLYQDKIKESGNYGLTIDSQKTLSVEPGIGIELGRNFYVNTKHKFILSTGVMNYLEVANPYKNQHAKIDNLSKNEYEIEKYDNDRFKTKLSLKEGYNFTNRLGVYFNQDYTISKHQDQFKYSANLIFVF